MSEPARYRISSENEAHMRGVFEQVPDEVRQAPPWELEDQLPEPTPPLEVRVQDVLARLDDVTARVMEIQGRRVSERLVTERERAEQVTGDYQAAAKDFSRHILPPRSAGYIPRARPAPE